MYPFVAGICLGAKLLKNKINFELALLEKQTTRYERPWCLDVLPLPLPVRESAGRLRTAEPAGALLPYRTSISQP